MKPRLAAAAAAILLGATGLLHAQQDLEGSVPANWSASNGNTLSISPHHFKMGAGSLRWDWSGGGTVTIADPGINPADVTDFNKHTCDFWVWNGTPVTGGEKLRVEFMNGSTPQYWFDFQLDYTGWRKAVRSYRYDMGKKSSPSSTFTSVRITAPASGSGSLYFDAVRWVGDRFTRIRDAQNVDIAGYLSSVGDHTAYGNVPDLPADAPTAAELADLATLRARWLAAAKGSSAPGGSSVTAAAASFAAMNIVEDADGIRGQTVDDLSAIDGWSSSEGWAMTLARDYAWGTATAAASRDKMLLVVKHLLDQGHAANSNTRPGIWYDNMNLSKALVLMAPACDAATRARLWEYFRWNFNLGEFWTTAWERSTDDIYCGVFQSLGSILFLAPDDTEAVRHLKGFKRHLERFLVTSEGCEDGIKPDGLGFHHNAHYNGYMYAWSPLIDTLYHQRGTIYQIDAPSYQNLRGTILTMMRMSADASGNDVGYHGHAIGGRKVFQMTLPFNRDHLRRLGELGGMILGQSADPEVARPYNRRFGVDNHALFTPYGAEDPPDGFLQFNYSPLGIYRRSNWVASIRSTQRYFWSSEIYTAENRYGRYQSYGALEILYHGGKAMSGEQLAGWDWNHMPGTTTIVLPDAMLIAEGSREDVRSQINFSGALAFHDGQCGLYAGNFQERNAGANHNPSFVWRKSWFAFGNQIVCLGSDIANNDGVNPTATTLFQGKLATTATPVTLDGNAITAFPHDGTDSGAARHWLLDAYGTGYLVAPGANLRLTRATQTSANHTGSGSPTTDHFAKAWLDHGTAPAGAGYEYAVIPGTDATAMTAAASQHADPATRPYQVIQRDSGAHVVKWKADGTTGYAVFNAGSLPAATAATGLLTTVERPCLVMARFGTDDDAWVSVVDPDLNFSNLEANYGVVDASVARTLDITVNGTWTLDQPDAGTSIVGLTATTTTVRVTTQHGFVRHVRLKSTTTPGTSAWANFGIDWNNPVNWGGVQPVDDTVTDIAALGAATVQPVLDGAYAVKGVTLDGGTTLSGSGHLTLGAGAIVATGTSNTISLANLTLANSQTWNIGTGELAVSSAIGGASGVNLTKAGAGTLTLSRANTYAGTTTVSGGVVNVLGDQQLADGGWTIKAGATVNFQPGSSIALAGGKAITLANESSALHTLNVAGNVSSGGNLNVHAAGVLNLNAGGAWTQNGNLTIQPLLSYYTPVMSVNAGGSFTYAGPSAISLSSSNGSNGGSATLNLNGGVFTTARNFHNASTGTAGSANLNFSNGGTLKLSADIPTLATSAGRPFNVQLGTGGGVIDTNGFATTITQGIAGSGGLTKQGAGTLALTGSSSHTGPTVVAAGTLAGNGTLASPVTVQAGAILDPAGTLTVTHTLALAGEVRMALSKSGAVPSSDKVAGLTEVTYGGSLTVSHLGPDPLAAGDSFQLFASNSYGGGFASIDLPPLAGGLVWDVGKLAIDGSIAVRAVPVAVADSAVTDEDVMVTIAVLANDSDADNDPLAIQSVTQGAHGTVAITGNQLAYTPAADWHGSDSFSYTITDHHDGTATATVSVTVNPVNDAPAFGPLADLNANEDEVITGNLASAASDIDENETLTFSKVSGPAWLTVAPDGTLSGTPANEDAGSNDFVLRVTDAAAATSDASLTITVANTNDAPVFAVDPITRPAANENQAYSDSLAGSASDVDPDDSLVFSKVSGPAWLSVAADGTLSGTPGGGDAGPNSFIVRATDAANAHDEATLDISVVSLPENDGVWANASGGSWMTPANWSGGLIASGVSRSADFSALDLTADAAMTLDGPRTLGSLVFGDTAPSHAWTIAGGGPLTLETNSGSPVVTVTNSSAALFVALAGNQGLTKAGAGTLTLAGSNTYGGLTTVSAGTLAVSGDHSAATGGLTINGGATVGFHAGSSVAVATGKTILLVNSGSAHALNVAGTVANAGALTLRGSSTLTLDAGGDWSQSGSMTLQPLNTHTDALVTVNSGASFTYTGSTNISVSASTANKQGTSTFALNGGTFTTAQGFHNATGSGNGAAYLQLSSGGTLRLAADIAELATTAGTPFTVQLGTGGGVIDTNGHSTTLGRAITGSGSFTKAGAGTLTLAGSGSVLSNVTVAGGTLSMSGLYLGNTASVTVASGASLDLNFSGAETIAALTIDGSALPSGTYNATTHPGFITGTGSLSVVSASAPPGFDIWAQNRSLSGDPGDDNDQDGTADLLEFVFGSDPQVATTVGPTSQLTDEGLEITFPRDDASEFSNLLLTVESGHDLESWPQVFQIGHTTETSSPGATVIENGDEPDTIVVTIPCDGCPRRFARVTAIAGN